MIMCRRPAEGLRTFLIDADKLGCIVNAPRTGGSVG